MLLEGIFLPLTTPFHPDGRLFPRKLEANVARYSLTPAAGLLIGGLEADALNDEDAQCVLETAMRAAADEKVMIAAVGRDSLVRTLMLSEAAADAGYDVIAVRAPGLADGAELLNYFRMVADHAELPVLLLSGAMQPPELAELVRHPNILGVLGGQVAELLARTRDVGREVTVTSVFAAATRRTLRRGGGSTSGLLSAASLSTGAATQAGLPAIKTRKKRVGVQVLGARTDGMLDAWRAGASGAMPLLGPCAPQSCCEVWQAFKDGDQPLAEEKQVRIAEAGKRVDGGSGIAAIKYGCDLNGYFGGLPRLPLLPLDGGQRVEMERLLAGLKT